MKLTRDEYADRVKDCQYPIYHETHRYCPCCPWAEDGYPGTAEASDDDFKSKLKSISLVRPRHA